MATRRLITEVTGTVWQILKKAGETVEADEAIMIVESMKMEIPVSAPAAGTVGELLAEEGATVNEGDAVAVLETSS